MTIAVGQTALNTTSRASAQGWCVKPGRKIAETLLFAAATIFPAKTFI
jgi:hypothetical protein